MWNRSKHHGADFLFNWVTLPEAALKLGVSKEKVLELIDQGIIIGRVLDRKRDKNKAEIDQEWDIGRFRIEMYLAIKEFGKLPKGIELPDSGHMAFMYPSEMEFRRDWGVVVASSFNFYVVKELFDDELIDYRDPDQVKQYWIEYKTHTGWFRVCAKGTKVCRKIVFMGKEYIPSLWASEILGVTVRQLTNIIKEGRLKVFKDDVWWIEMQSLMEYNCAFQKIKGRA